jgi:hypothetical protein
MKLVEVVEAEKTLSGSHAWLSREPNQLSLVSPLECDGVTMLGVQLRMRVTSDLLDRAVMIQLESTSPSGKGERLIRIDWRPISPHVNKGNAPDPWKFAVITTSHIHRFEHNYRTEKNAMRRGNLPVAVPIEPDPESFPTLLEFAGKELKIQDLHRIETPDWQGRIF